MQESDESLAEVKEEDIDKRLQELEKEREDLERKKKEIEEKKELERIRQLQLAKEAELRVQNTASVSSLSALPFGSESVIKIEKNRDGEVRLIDAGSRNTHDDFLNHAYLFCDQTQLTKGEYIYGFGTQHNVAKGCEHVYMHGKNNHAKEKITQVYGSGTHGWATNAGETFKAIAVSKNGVCRIGGAQDSTILLTAHVDKKSKRNLMNPNVPFYLSTDNDKLQIPNRNTIARLSLIYSCVADLPIASSDGPIWETGTATNTVWVDDNGHGKFSNSLFKSNEQDIDGKIDNRIEFRGVDICGPSNNFSIEVVNNSDYTVRILVRLDMLILSS
jgi:hypothetical protein